MDPPTADVIFFDGSASPNPGPMLIALVHGSHARLQHLDGTEGGNNQAEFRAAVAALTYAAQAGLYRPTIAGDLPEFISPTLLRSFLKTMIRRDRPSMMNATAGPSPDA